MNFPGYQIRGIFCFIENFGKAGQQEAMTAAVQKTKGCTQPRGTHEKERVRMTTTTAQRQKVTQTGSGIRKMTMTAMLSAIAFILMFFDFSVPVMPGFIKMDISDLPELIGAFAMGPVCGVAICLVKNLLHLFMTTTGGVGELSNFLLSACFVLPAGIIYRRHKGKRTAFFSASLGAVLMAGVSVITNYFIVYPVYYHFMPKNQILEAYQAIFGGVDSILDCLLVFNMPFTFAKGMLCVVITMLVYKYISPVIKGTGA